MSPYLVAIPADRFSRDWAHEDDSADDDALPSALSNRKKY